MNFENDVVFQFIKNIPLPFINRLNRETFKDRRDVDLLFTYRKVLVGLFAGYWVGKLLKHR